MNFLFNYLLLPLRAVAGLPRKLLGLSLAARVAWLIAVFLVVSVVTAYVAFYFSQNRTPWESWWRPGRLAAIALLVIAIPLVVYQALRLWLEGDVSRFPDIDHAWKAGLAELTRQGLDLEQIPIFLVLGGSGNTQQRSLFQAARINLRLKEIPTGQAALHWYAGPDAIYLCTTEVGQLSRVSVLGEKIQPAAAAPAPTAAAREQEAIRGTIMAAIEPSFHRPPIAVSGFMPAPSPTATAASSAEADLRGTMMVARDMNVGNLMAQLTKASVSLSPQEAVEQQLRLEYLCRLIWRARQPLCPINGILALLPFRVIEHGAQEAVAIEQAVKNDLESVARELKIRCPVTALVVGLEGEPGFRELVRRVGFDRARGQRFGKGFGIWGAPSAQQLEAVCLHACGAFEDWLYALFREAGGLTKAGNAKLYSLLCRVRRNVQQRLSRVLVQGFLPNTKPGDANDGLLFGGCYFAAVGESEERQAFVKGVLDKLPEQQEELQWNDQARAAEQRFQRIAAVLWTANALLVVVLAGTLGYKLWGG